MKTRKYFYSSCVLAVLVLLLSFNNCSRPLNFEPDSASLKLPRTQDIIVGNPLVSKTLLANICSTLSSCHPELSLAACETGILNTTGIETQLGLAKGSMKIFSEIVQAETDGALRGDVAAMSSCTSEIQKLTCSDTLVQSAYSSSASDPFAGVAFMIPTTPGTCPVVFSQPPTRTEYFVSTSGSDLNDGSKDKPWATISHASQALIPGADGATVHVAPGNYYPVTTETCITNQAFANSCGILTARSGTASAPIVYISDAPGAAKIIPADAYSVWYNTGDYVQIVGFEIIGNSATNVGIENDGSYVRIERNRIHDIPVSLGCSRSIGGGGVAHSKTSSIENETIGNVIYNIGPRPGNGLAAGSYCNHAHGIHYRQARGRIHNNMIYRIGTWGIVTWATATNLQITNNLIFDAGSRDNVGSLMGGGIALAANAAVLDDTTVSNNIIRNNSGAGLHDRGATGTNNLFANNVLYGNGANTNFKAGTADVGSILADPQMIGFAIDGSGDYRLKASSPAVNAGTMTCATGSGCTPAQDSSGFLRPYGAAIDIGPYEWHP